MIRFSYHWLHKVIFFNVPLKKDKEYVRKLYYTSTDYDNDVFVMRANGWRQIHYTFDFLANIVVWYEHDKFY